MAQLQILGAEHQHQPTGTDDGLPFLDHDSDEHVVGGNRDHIGVAHEIDTLGQQEAQRRLRQWIEILRREPRVAHDNRGAVGDDFGHARAVVGEVHLARLQDIELAFGAAAVGTDLYEIANKSRDGREIETDAVDQRTLVGIEAARLARLGGERRGNLRAADRRRAGLHTCRWARRCCRVRLLRRSERYRRRLGERRMQRRSRTKQRTQSSDERGQTRRSHFHLR